MSPNEQKMTSGRDAISRARSIISSGVTQTGQPGPWMSSIWLGQELVDAVADDRVRLAAADLHDRPGPGRGGLDLGEEPAREGRVLELVEVLHGTSVSDGRARSSMACRAPRTAASVSSAESSSSWVMAKPAWTMV